MLSYFPRFSIIGLAVGLLLVGTIGCGPEEGAKRVSLEKRERLTVREALPEKEPFRIAIGAMITPKEGFAYYRHLLDYIEEKIDRPVKFVDRKSYAEINALLKTGVLDAAFVCSRPFVDGHDEFGLELLVVPQAYGKTVYYSYIIVHVDSPVKNFEELQGKTFAFTDPDSNTGKLVPTYMLARMNETPDSFFEKYVFTYAHDKSIQAVALKVVDGAAVDSLVWDYLDKTNPEFTSKIKVIWKSPPYGIPPVVVRPDLDTKTKNKLRETLLGVHEDEIGKEIIKGMMIDKFVVSDDAAYDAIREMRDWIAKQREET